MKIRLIKEINQLKEKTTPNSFLYKKYTNWINQIEENKISPDLIKFLNSKASHTLEQEYSDFLLKLANS